MVDREIAEQPAILERVIRRPAWEGLAERIVGSRPRGVLTVARGSSDHAATFFSYLALAHAGVPVASVPPSIATHYRSSPIEAREQIALGVSQSGKSPDVVHTLESLRRGGALALAVTNDADSPLARAAEHVIALECGEERAIAATKTFTASLAALAALVAAWTKNAALRSQLERVPEAAARALEVGVERAAAILASSPVAFVLGRGFGLAVALEGALKLKEIARIHAEGVSAAEFMHGPVASVGAGLPMVVLACPQWDAVPRDTAIVTKPLERGGLRALSLEAAANLSVLHNARVILLGASSDEAKSIGALAISQGTALPGELAPIAQAIVLQRLAVATARARGLDPDAPSGLAKVTETW
ncbi:SIS domain-containing protein [bacterium]|nr:SIS domain-containing protein [bacterium]